MNADYQQQLNWIDSQHQQMVDTVIELAEINSGSTNLGGLDQVKNKLIEKFNSFNTEITSIDLPDLKSIDNSGSEFQQKVGQAISMNKYPNAPLQVLLMGHMDTVYDVNHPFQHCKWLDNNTLNGPGVADLKGGLVILHTALTALEQSPWAGQIGWQVLINPDEEIGSLSSSSLIEKSAQKNDLGLIFEPSLPDGTLAGARKGSGNFSVVTAGKAAHAGREHHLGRNAIRAMADFTSQLDDLNGQVDGITINPGFVHGGGPVNIVPDTAILKFNVRITQAEHEKWFLDQLEQIIDELNHRDGINLKLYGKFGRKPKLLDENISHLFDLIKQTGESLKTNISWKDTGGCCDGNNLAAAGLPNIDTMGTIGGSIHSSEEYIKVDSLTERAKLTALLLMQLASGEMKWHINSCQE